MEILLLQFRPIRPFPLIHGSVLFILFALWTWDIRLLLASSVYEVTIILQLKDKSHSLILFLLSLQRKLCTYQCFRNCKNLQATPGTIQGTVVNTGQMGNVFCLSLKKVDYWGVLSVVFLPPSWKGNGKPSLENPTQSTSN